MITATSVFVSLLLSALGCWLVLSTQKRHIRWTGDGHNAGPQKIHRHTVPRVGGVAAALGIAAGAGYLQLFGAATDLWPFLLILLPSFLAGLLEDLTKKVSPMQRYAATGLSAALFCWAYGLSVQSVDIGWIDQLLAIPTVAILFTVFAVGNASHAFNLIDGQNGLCAGVSALCLGAIAYTAHQHGATAVFQLALIGLAANLGFLLFNYPRGLLFLGDAGAYANGAMVCLLLVWLTAIRPEISPWYALTVLIYPVWETLFTIGRRFLQGKPVREPDSEHLHSLLYRRSLSRGHIRGASTAPRIVAIHAAFCLLAVVFFASSAIQMALCVGFIGAYQTAYYLVKRDLAISQAQASNGAASP